MIDESIREIKALQIQLDQRSKIEAQASKMIAEGKYDKAIEILKVLE